MRMKLDLSQRKFTTDYQQNTLHLQSTNSSLKITAHWHAVCITSCNSLIRFLTPNTDSLKVMAGQTNAKCYYHRWQNDITFCAFLLNVRCRQTYCTADINHVLTQLVKYNGHETDISGSPAGRQVWHGNIAAVPPSDRGYSSTHQSTSLILLHTSER